MNAAFVPVALKAGLVNNPPDDEEGRLCREIGRSKLAPQGICVVNSAGKVLAWTMAFDDDKSVLAFLDHSAKRFARFPDAKKPVAAERYMKFPSAKLADVEDSGKVPVIAKHHPEGKSCPAQSRLRKGTIVARVFGRALDKDGKPIADTVRQEHYVEDRFHVPVAMQETLAQALADAGAERFKISSDLARLLVSHAYLGQLDVNPVGGVPTSKGNLKHCEFWARVESGGKGPVRLCVEGKSEAAGVPSDGQNGDGRLWQHDVKLTWEGIMEMKKDRMIRLLLVASGSEKLKWGNKNLPELKGQADVTVLVGGHAIDLSCGVRYGIIGEPVAADEAGDAEAPEERPQEVPAEAGRQLMETLGPAFMVFRDKVQKELKLSDEQKKKLEKRLQDTVQDTMQFFQKLADKEPEEREKELHAYRERAQENLTAFLQGLLQEEQSKRLRQVMLQRDRLFALLGNAEVAKELEITDKQRQHFSEVAQEMQKKIEPLANEAQKGGNPQEIGPKIRKIRKEQEERIEALLSVAQKKQWKKMLGKPLVLDD
ncbi:MAG TPA: hypothetical protein VG013_28605 [Gemmataceae bacterium]|nr:hypothetical protein [Gemmataceae bacterium]